MIKSATLSAAILLCATWGHAQVDDPLGGAKQPRPDLNLRRQNQYKRVHQLALRAILRLQFDEAEAFLEGYRQEFPSDAETHYMLGLLAARLNDGASASRWMAKAVALGLPEQRIVAGPRGMFRGVLNHPYFRNLTEKYANIPLHGPLVGDVTAGSASFWVRTARESAVRVLLHPKSDGTSGIDLRDAALIRSEAVTSRATNDFTAVVRVGGLKPNTDYAYAIAVDDQVGPAESFRTFPPAAQAAQFRIAFGGGAGFVPPHERMWDTIGELDPLALLLLGDNVYIDDPESVIMQQYTYQRRQSRPEWRRLTSRSAVFTIWDDHDFSTNDTWGGPLIDTPFWKLNYAWPIFRQNWANPGYAGGEQQPGCWYQFSIGDVDFIMLDCRYYRTDPRTERPSMLGPVQLRWLEQAVLASQGTFKVLCSSVPWDFRTKGDSLDTWNGYKDERNAIFRFLEEHQVEGVLLMSADRHRSDAWRIDRASDYALYEFNSSRLTNQHVHPTREQQGAIFSYNAKQSFGLVEFDTTLPDPTATYSVVSIDGEQIHSLSVKRSQLQRD